jgi:hypothetical protein
MACLEEIMIDNKNILKKLKEKAWQKPSRVL